ncbi:MAG: tetratricopeptide repeat protein [Chitinophagales bacterium]|nr:tetratricopeptide repeat protein [Chitinophagales bacterium]
MKYFRIFILLSFSISLFFISKANEKDSIVIKEMVMLAMDTADVNFDIALHIFNQAEKIAVEKKIVSSQGDLLLDKGVIYFNHSKYQEAIDVFKKAADLFKGINNVKEIRCYYNMGYCYTYLNDYKSALGIMFDGLKLAIKYNEKSSIGSLYTNISIAYQNINDYDNALKYAGKSLAIKKTLNDSSGIASLYNNIGLIYTELQKYQLAIDNFKKAVQLHSELGATSLQASSLSNLSIAYGSMQNLDSALYYGKNAVRLYGKPNYLDYSYCIMLASMGDILVKSGHLLEAKEYLEPCNRCKENSDYEYYTFNHYSFFSSYYSKIGNYKEAYQNLNHLLAVKDSIHKESVSIENQKMSIQYEFEQKAKVDSLNHKLELSKKDSIAKSYKIRMYVILSILILLIAFTVLIINRIKNRQHIERIVHLEKMRNDIASDLHDDIGSTLSSIKIFSDLAIKQSEQGKDIKATLLHVSNLTNKIANNIREIVWSINPSNDTIEILVDHLRKIATEIIGTSEIQLIFDINIEKKDVKILPNKRRNIIMVFKEAINNARKYSNTDIINIQFNQKGSQLHLVVKDFGKGFDLNKIDRGNGLSNMEKRADEIGGKVSILSVIEKGTEISLKVSVS